MHKKDLLGCAWQIFWAKKAGGRLEAISFILLGDDRVGLVSWWQKWKALRFAGSEQNVVKDCLSVIKEEETVPLGSAENGQVHGGATS